MDTKKHVFFFDAMRCCAALAVIVIHALAPYRHQLGDIPMGEWITAISFNGFSRWAVPVFILITGALMLNDKRPFDLKYYLSRRLGKVLVPFIVWSIFYAFLSGWSLTGFDSSIVSQILANSFHHQTYYHLGFFYYFIPLYFAIPFLQALVKRYDDVALYALTAIWLLTTLLFLLRIDGPWSEQFWLYMGLLPLGYVLYQKLPLNRTIVIVAVILGLGAMALGSYMVIENSIQAERYSVGRWFSYKTINTVLAASMVFILCKAFADRLNSGSQRVVSFISKHSLGIYILHPLFLWPMNTLHLYQGHPMMMIPIWVLISGGGALALSYLLSLSAKTRWLLP
ncbi:acyltransferase [Vibrio hippocampi]|uniref:O-acetyltransferase WecH n=1 Tax=Vibrio hippocampi TaxID=654686 RepID=A0ABM8ZEG1_9VIBR|nr:acyltransferase family protein [Vibrio hippocampi]CAH0524321.1 O-acetyltransferase WecH [Vibrio hippocampi]